MNLQTPILTQDKVHCSSQDQILCSFKLTIEYFSIISRIATIMQKSCPEKVGQPCT